MNETSYQPAPGEVVLLTVRATLDSDGIYHMGSTSSPSVNACIGSANEAIVHVEPLPKSALPTAFGSRIRATIRGEQIELVLGDPGSGHVWMAKGGNWYGDADLSDVTVLHDPDAQEPAESAAPEPTRLPTGLGAVLKCTYRGDRQVVIRVDGSGMPWINMDGVWIAGSDLTDVTVLHPGIEVELP